MWSWRIRDAVRLLRNCETVERIALRNCPAAHPCLDGRGRHPLTPGAQAYRLCWCVLARYRQWRKSGHQTLNARRIAVQKSIAMLASTMQ